jgi:hypothetical protein
LDIRRDEEKPYSKTSEKEEEDEGAGWTFGSSFLYSLSLVTTVGELNNTRKFGFPFVKVLFSL